MITPEQALKVINGRFGVHAGRRAFHAKGLISTGTFTATPEAAGLTRAAHMRGESVPVVARFSNGGGDPNVPDYVQDVRGLAVSFELPDGSATDIVSQTAPRFSFSDPDSFMEFVAASAREPAALVKLPWFLVRHPKALLTLRENMAALGPPASYAVRRYYPVHAFRWIDPEGAKRWVRYLWKPDAEEPDLDQKEAKSRGRDYLQDELRERVASGPIRYELEIQIAAEEDDPHDPASHWPDDRETFTVGRLELTALTDEHDERIFDPMRLTDGIEPSDDPILRFRPKVYSLSYEARTGSG